MDVESMTVAELKRELKLRDLKTGGLKADLKARLLEALTDSNASNSTANTEEHPTDGEAQQTDFADFENYINDEYKKIADGHPLNGNGHDTDAQSVNIEEIISKNNANVEQEEEEKNVLLESDFDLQPATKGHGDHDGNDNDGENTKNDKGETMTVPDFSEEAKALDAKSKIEERRQRFGITPVMDEKAKIESRKRRFGALNDGEQDPEQKKIDQETKRRKVFERAQKFGTKLPKNFKLTKEEAELVHSDKMKRAERFGTQHLLPSAIQKAKFDEKKAERMKRFQTNETKTEDIAVSPEQRASDATKVMERKLRFGTMSEADKMQKRKDKFGDKTLDEIAAEKKGMNKMSHRQLRNKRKFQEMRANTKGRGRRGGRGRGNGRGFRGSGRGRGRGRGGGGRGRFGGNRQYRLVDGQFSAEDQARMNDRRLRFNQ